MWKDYLNEQEIAAIEKFTADSLLFEAVKKVILEGLYYNGVMLAGKPANAKINAAYHPVAVDPTISNEKAGELIKAMWQGLNFLEVGFARFAEIKAPPKAVPEPKKVNKAR